MHTRIVLLSLVAVLLSGCGPRVKILDATARRVQAEGELQAIAFTTTASARGMAGQQLIYQVRLLDGRMRPLRSRDNRYSNAAGEVAATKSLLVFDSPWRFENVTIAIPAKELEVSPSDLPVGAEFSMLDASGVAMAQAYQRVPLYAATIEGSQPLPAYARRPVDAPPTEAPAAAEAPVQQAEAQQRVAAPTPAPVPEPEPEPEPEPAPVRRVVQAPAPDPVPAAAPAPVANPDPPVSNAGASSDLYAQLQSEEVAPRRAEPAPREASGSVPPWARRAAQPTGREEILSRQSEAPTEPRPRIYVVQEGDTLTRIARRIYGDSARWIELFEFNRHQLDSPDLIYTGLELLVPPEGSGRSE